MRKLIPKINYLNQYILVFWVLTTIYSFIVFFPLPHGIHIGLDPSWQYVLSYTTSEKLTYGKDIIFTYGPLGYLIDGAATGDNLWIITLFRGLVHVIFYAVSTIEIFKLYKKKKWNILLVFILSVALYYLLSLFAFTDYSILFIFLYILSYEKYIKKKYKLISYIIFLGLFAGFCLMTKFSLGICALGAGILYYSGNAIQDFKNRQNIIKNLYKLSIFTVTTFWSASIYLDGLSKSNASLIKYLKGCLEISSGYSSAMSIVNSPWEVIYAILQIVLILIILIKLSKNKQNSLGYSLVIAFITWITFKHGFIRQDGHILIFVKFIPLLVFLSLKNSVYQGNKNIFYNFVYYLTVFNLLLYLLIPAPFGQIIPDFYSIHKNTISFANFSHKFSNIIDLSKYQQAIIESNQRNLSTIKLPINVLNNLEDRVVDVVPWEISLIPANNLTWQPRPIFQSYLAYTSKLDKINSKSLLENMPDNIFYQFLSIDGRHPFFDEPKTFSYIFCNYEPSVKIPDFVEIPNLSNIILLEKVKENRCSSTSLNEIFSIGWDAPHFIKDSNEGISFAKVKFQYSLVGKIYKTLFRVPPVMMKIDYVDGSQKTYRIIPGNSDNGIIVSHLPKDDNEAISFFRGQLSGRVKSFSFQISNSLLFAPNIEISFSSVLLRY